VELARSRGDQTFLVYEDETWSFAETMRHVDALAAALVHRFGVAPGDRVAIAMRNYPEWIVAFGAITSVGAVAVSLNAWWTADETDFGLRDSGSRVLIADPERALRAAATLAATGAQAIAVRSSGAALPAGAQRYEDVVALGAAMPDVAIDPHADATILYTSGTTGAEGRGLDAPRGALGAPVLRLSGGRARDPHARDRRAEEASDQLHPRGAALPRDRLRRGDALVRRRGLQARDHAQVESERALELIERERITNFVGVPTMSWDLLESPDFARRDTSSLKAVGRRRRARAARARAPDRSRLPQRGPGIGYGMTETNAYGPQNAGSEYLRRPTSCGRTVPVVEIRVTDERGTPLPAGAVGEIWFRGPNLIRGYWNRPDATAETIVDGWLRSGDLGRIDDEGFLYVEDRAKDMVLRAGENVYCAEVEAAIYEHPAVYEAAVFGLPHERLGEEVAAAIYLKPGAQVATDELQQHVRQRLAAFKVPSVVEFAAAPLPRNASGKILKRQIRDALAASRRPEPPIPWFARGCSHPAGCGLLESSHLTDRRASELLMYTPLIRLPREAFALSPDPRFLYLSRPTARCSATSSTDRAGRRVHGDHGRGRHGQDHALPHAACAGSAARPRWRSCSTRRSRRSSCSRRERRVRDLDLRRVAARAHGRAERLLVEQRIVGRKVLLIIDEAQNLSTETLEQLRLLSNLETETSKLLQIVLLGSARARPEARRQRSAPAAPADQRVEPPRPMNAEETREYVRHRLRVAGPRSVRSSPRARCARVHQRTGGVPRVINLLCDRALLAGYADQKRSDRPRGSSRARRELRPSRPRLPGSAPRRARRRGVLLALGLFAWIGSGAFSGHERARRDHAAGSRCPSARPRHATPTPTRRAAARDRRRSRRAAAAARSRRGTRARRSTPRSRDLGPSRRRARALESTSCATALASERSS
jgi:long-chain acyl-CoA synthetase